MSKKLKVIREASLAVAATAASSAKSGDKQPDAQKLQQQKSQMDRSANKKAVGAVPKNNASVFSPKPEPNRGVGADRHPSTPKGHVTRPTMEGRESEYTANSQLSASKKRNPGHYLMRNGTALHSTPHPTAQAALNAYHALPNKEGVKIHQVKEETITELSKKTMGSYVAKAAADAADKASAGGWKHAKSQDDGLDDGEKEDKKAFKRLQGIKKAAKKLSEDGAVAVSVGSGAVAGITDPTTNYAFQAEKKKKHLKQVKADMVRRKKPIGEELSAGIGNTQTPAGTKKEKGMKGKKTAVAPSTQNGSGDAGTPIGGQ